MGRILVMSDSHGRISPLREVMQINADVKTVFFLGDGEEDILQIIREYPDKNIYRVRGNCDFGSTVPLLFNTTLEYSNVTVTAVHGHLQNVKYSLTQLEDLAEKTKAHIVLYGHTHKPDIIFKDGVYYICPGSVSSPRDGGVPSYAFIDITDINHIVGCIAPVPPYKI